MLELQAGGGGVGRGVPELEALGFGVWLEETIQRIFGTSQAFRSFDEIRPTLSEITVPLKVREYYHRGHWCLEREDWETAVVFFSRAIHLDPQLVEFYALRAEAYIQLCDYSSAVQNLRRAHSFQPENTQFLKRLTLVLYLQGQCLFEQCAFADALNVFSQAFELQPEKPSFRYRCMACLLALRRYQDCLSLVTKEVEHDATNADIYILRARLYNSMGKAWIGPRKPQDKTYAITAITELTAQRDIPKQIIRWNSKAGAVRMGGMVPAYPEKGPDSQEVGLPPPDRPHLCYQDLHNALVLDPKHTQAKVLLKTMVEQSQKSYRDARILAVQGKLQHAVQCVNCAIDNNPLDPSFFLFRGTMYRRLRDFDAAVEDFLKALDMMSEHQEDMVRQAQRQLLLAYNDFALHCYTQGAYQEGVLLLNKVLKDEQREKGLYINRGDCFFQLGYLNFAEADYQEALALSPSDEGANLRMSLLQEKMGCCEHRSRQFQKAESHFTLAIQHNPQMAQYYLHRARSRQFIQNIFGARQDVATALILDPKQPKLLSLITHLFPGMSAEEVLGSQVGLLAKMQLSRVVESRMKDNISQGIMGQLYKQELERQKAEALQLSWKEERVLWETKPQLDSTSLILQEEPERPEEAVDAKKEEKPEKSLSDSYPDQTSSVSMLGFRTLSVSETETSTTCQEYRSTSATPVPLTSDSSLLRTQSSDLGKDREDSSLNLSPTDRGQSQLFSKTEVTRSQSQKPSKAKAAQGPRQRPSKTEATQGPRPKPSKTEATQGPRPKPSKTEATQGPRQRLRKTKAVHRRSPIKAEGTQGRTRGLMRSSSKTKNDDDPSWSPSNTEDAQGEGQWLIMAKVLENWNQSPSPESSKTDVIQDQSQNPSLGSVTALQKGH
ncbi:Tetratricopeptide repeat protein 16 [Myotis davidii]|uniref:Tetratricopeptide repeat protein 16 n=1 Tax=Myotis davidii TaxID=225400 RepID=L5LK67_MYODS|nr:Tetratricopeptide repeat protein 16 [Myotis davidii]